MIQKINFGKNQFFWNKYFYFWSQNAFIYLQKTFTKTLILHHFDLECYIWIENNALKYTISKILNQITLDQLSSSHVIYKNFEPNFKSEIGQ